jgi:DNA recombination protein RmuC
MTLVIVLLILGLFLMLLLTVWALLRPVQVLTQTQVELRTLSERLGSIERNQGQLTGALTGSTSTLQTELSRALEGLTELRAQATERAKIDQQVGESVRRLETILAGTHSKGAAGENILELVFAKLPPEWQVRNFQVGAKTVEFALRLPNNRLLPIDSKWPATDLIEQLAVCRDPIKRQDLKSQIEGTVRLKAREVRKYLHPDYTVNFGIAAIPDSAYDVCSSMHAECFQNSVVLVAYSMFVPYLLLVFQMALASSQHIDMERLASYLSSAEDGVRNAQAELEGRHARALSMLSNSGAELSKQLSTISHGLRSIHVDGGSESVESDEVPVLPSIAPGVRFED